MPICYVKPVKNLLQSNLLTISCFVEFGASVTNHDCDCSNWTILHSHNKILVTKAVFFCWKLFVMVAFLEKASDGPSPVSPRSLVRNLPPVRLAPLGGRKDPQALCTQRAWKHCNWCSNSSIWLILHNRIFWSSSCSLDMIRPLIGKDIKLLWKFDGEKLQPRQMCLRKSSVYISCMKLVGRPSVFADFIQP